MKRVVLVEDHPAFRQALDLVLGRSGDMEVVASVGTVARGMELARGNEACDLWVVDLMLPDGHGSEVVKAIKRGRPGTPVLVLSASEDLSSALEAGADEVLGKDTPLPQLVASMARMAAPGA